MFALRNIKFGGLAWFGKLGATQEVNRSAAMLRFRSTSSAVMSVPVISRVTTDNISTEVGWMGAQLSWTKKPTI